jgi:hypothetical protein
VPIKKRKATDSIYEEVQDYDLVLTTDAPLSDAINQRLTEPVFGDFANTPRRMVRNRFGDSLEKRELFAKATRETDMTWKQASYLIDLTVECWQHTGDPTDILDTRFSSPEVKETLEIVQDSNSIYSRMEEYTIDDDLDVAVVGWYMFDELDKKVLPDDYDRVSVFRDEKLRLPEFSVFESATSLLEAIRDNVTPENAEDIAVVAEVGSKKEKLVKSALETDGVPYTDSTSVADSDGLRTLFKLLRTSLESERVKVSEVRPILRRMGLDGSVPIEKDEVYLPDLDVSVPELEGFLSGVSSMTFGEAVDRYERLSGEDMEGPRQALREVRLLEKEITDGRVNSLRYYLDSYDVGGETDTGGVLFADPSATTAERPIVFYLDISESWTAEIPDRPWIEKDRMNEKHLNNFQMLLQNGKQQYYLVQEAEGGKEVTPCFYFHELLDRDEIPSESIEGFTSLPHSRYTGISNPTSRTFAQKGLDVDVEELDTFSQSSLNKFVESPRAYFFDRVLGGTENRYTVRGTVIHDFAEFYANYPEFVREKGLKEFIEETLDRVGPYVDDLEEPILRTGFSKAAEVVADYIDTLGIPGGTPSGYEKMSGSNIFAEVYDKPIGSGATELWFKNYDIGGHGIVDLVVDDSTLLDYKTGSKDNASSVIKRAKPQTHEPEDADFQPILYLAHHRGSMSDFSDTDTDTDDGRMEFRLLYMLDSVGDRIGDGDEPPIEDDVTTIPYVDMAFEEYVSSREAFDSLCEVGKIDKSFSKMGYQPYKEYFGDRTLPEEAHDKDALRDALLEDFTDYVKEYVGDYKYVRGSCRSALGNIAGMRGKDILFEDDVDEFVDFVEQKIAEANAYRHESNGFPVGEVDLEELNEKELILKRDGARTGEKADTGGGEGT